jgi:DNA ligase (NAD+)
MYTVDAEKTLFEDAKAFLTGAADTLPPDEAISRLISILRHAEWKYYVENEPQLADVEYDTLYKKLQGLETDFPDLQQPDSPTQRIARALSERFPQVAHLVPMLSLDNTYNAQDLYDWDRRVQAGAQGAPVQYCVEPKYDGASISLIYEKGKLVRGATRGDGVMGEDITLNVRQIRTLPLSAQLQTIETLEIRGEVVIHKNLFEQYNKQRAEAGLSILANPRNAASGTLRMLDPAEVRNRNLTAILYHVSDAEVASGTTLPEAFDTHYDTLQWLYRHGFPTPAKELRLFDTIDEVIAYLEAFETRRDSLPFEIDGAVVKVNNLHLQEQLGMTSHHPRWAVAYKFAARQATTVLRRVEFNVNRTGSVTPVAKTDPVAIGGVMVSSATLFNEDFIREKNLMLGDTVLIERAGDVIPYLVKSLPELRDGSQTPIVYPSQCPVCGSQLEKEPEDPIWRCLNAACPAQAVERIIHYSSKDAMDIRGLGESVIRKFFELGLLRSLPMLYTLDWPTIQGMEGFGAKKIENLQKAIEASKKQPLSRFLFGLGIPQVGEGMGKTLAGAVETIQELYEFDEARLMALNDVGPKVAASIRHFFEKAENRELITGLQALGVEMRNAHRSKPAEGGAFFGKTFLFTGTLAQMKRSEGEAMVEARGGTLLGGVSAKLNYLVVGTDAGSKLEKAKKLGSVAILSEDEFLNLLKETPEPAPSGTEGDSPESPAEEQGQLF